MIRSLSKLCMALPRTRLSCNWIASVASAPALASVSPVSHSSATAFPSVSPLQQHTFTRGFQLTHGFRSLNLLRRSRRLALRRIAKRTRGADNYAHRLSQEPTQLASFDTVTANLHQFIIFLRRQHMQRIERENDAEANKLPRSTASIRAATAPAWQLDIAHIRALMLKKGNQTMRACEEVSVDEMCMC